ncbi:MAG: NAD(P)-dependent oxidoreductase [Candidatus Krumholzibacteriota bacterium]|nr:NAD(P)-dependent oxidoreductase [Candidatus Krumholzibacteriota bacterium]
MKLLVFGADGFIGRRFVEFFAGKYQIIPIHDYIEKEFFDLTVYDNMLTIIDKHRPDAVLNLAGKSYHTASDNADIYESNVLIQLNLNKAVEESGLKSRIVFCSSSSVYKSSLEPVGEDASCIPMNAYARSKYIQERVSLSYHPDQQVVIARLFNVIGPGQSRDYFIPAVIGRMIDYKNGKTAAVKLKTLNATRDFIFIDDVCSAISTLIDNGLGGEIYNVCCGRGVPLDEVLELLKIMLGLSELALEVQEDHVEEGINYQAGSNRKILDLGWAPSYDIKRSLEEILKVEHGK